MTIVLELSERPQAHYANSLENQYEYGKMASHANGGDAFGKRFWVRIGSTSRQNYNDAVRWYVRINKNWTRTDRMQYDAIEWPVRIRNELIGMLNDEIQTNKNWHELTRYSAMQYE